MTFDKDELRDERCQRPECQKLWYEHTIHFAKPPFGESTTEGIFERWMGLYCPKPL